MRFDWLRLKAKLRNVGRKNLTPSVDKLHVGCGTRRVEGWLNVDVVGSEHDIDLAAGNLPWQDNSFRVITAQQVVEHLELNDELIPLLRELKRIATINGEIWLSCPDMAKVCQAYIDNRGTDMVVDRQQRWSRFSLNGAPTQQMVNVLFHQDGQHKNLYDFELLKWALEQAGFVDIRRTCEDEFIDHFPEFPRRNDDYHSLYVVASA